MLDGIMQVVTSSYLIAVLLVALYMIYRKDNRVYALVLTLALTLALVTFIKESMVELRPCVAQIPLDVCGDPIESFPSMHAALAFAPLVFLLPNIPLFALYFIYAALVSFSRVYLYVHYPHDVAAGAIISVLIGLVCLKAKDKINSIIYDIAETVGVRKYLV